MSKSTRGFRVAGVASLAVTLSLGVAAPAFADADFAFDRIGGEDRYQTAALVADEYRTVNPDAILANGQPGFYADALSGNYLAGEIDAPILLTRLKQIPDYTLEQLDEMGAENVWVVGGEGVVPPAQVQQLESEGYNVERIAGDDRFLTNAEVIEAGGAAKDGLGIVATGFDFPDALGGGPLTYQGHPVGLSTENNIKQAVIDALKGAGVDEVLILGGEAVVGSEVATKLEANGIEVRERLAGANRSGTAAEVAEYAVAELGFSDKGVNVASGYTEGYGADALAGGPLTGKQDRPMLITRNVDNPGAETLAYLEEHCETLTDGIIFGQTGAVSAAAEDEMNEAATCELPGATSRPELVSAQIVGTTTTGQQTPTNPVGTTVRYTFDEPIANAGGLAPTAANFHVYNKDAFQYSGDTPIVSVSGNEVVVRFAAINTAALASALTVATVDENAARQTDGTSNIIGDAAIGTASGGSTSTLPAGITVAPDLVSVGNFRQAADSGDTAVDFTFDEAAKTVTGADFDLILLNGNVVETVEPGPTDTTAGGGTVPGGNGTTTITVVVNGAAGDPLLTAADVARGVVAEGSVVEQTNNESTGTTDPNPLQAAEVSNSGNTTDPDLVSVQLRPDTDTDGAGTADTDVDQALFTFDQAVTAATAGSFFLYKTDGTPVGGTAREISSDGRQVLVDFTATATDNAVGGNIIAGAVTPTNDPDEVGVANSSTGASQTPGRTSAPDLTGVALSDRTSGGFGTVTGTYATYTFDEVVTEASIDPAKFFLYLADGTKLTTTSCVFSPAAGAADDNTVRCAFEPGGTPVPSATYAKAAVVGAVDNNAVKDASGAQNPEGAEFTTGGTGTPAS